ncbi:hypothetical protein IEQ34_013170 [Dendrobium chrysotoxum]|uniref:Uncharacterized protein n=1 Tax=Dendrobium chrysotoxum TaxID=161865 RepID=A0AAV7GNR3_DENCH|nr:hypothetical protein IEQ34_013170 [Dendrobium chrysotoxum]
MVATGKWWQWWLAAGRGSGRWLSTVAKDDGQELHSPVQLQNLGQWELAGQTARKGPYLTHKSISLRPPRVLIRYDNSLKNLPELLEIELQRLALRLPRQSADEHLRIGGIAKERI